MERKIIIGLITSTDFLKQMRNIWDPSLIESATAKMIASWCWEYYNKYDKAPLKDIEGIYYSKLKSDKIPKGIAEEIEEEILPGLSAEYKSQSYNLNYLLEESFKHFQERQLSIHSDSIQALVDAGELIEAEKLACDFKPLSNGINEVLDLSNDIVLDRVDKAFNTTNQCLIRYPKQLGEFWNSQLVRGAFVAIMAIEKKGKTFLLLDMGLRACKQGRKVAFLQAGDMTEDQQLIRICIYLSRKSNMKKYCETHWEPVRDCIHNQLNTCDKEERNCSFGVFEGLTTKDLEDIELPKLIEAFEDNKDYETCSACDDYQSRQLGTVWIKKVKETTPLTAEEAKEDIKGFFIKNRRQFKLSSHANGTLSVNQIIALLGVWEKQDGFVPDIIIIDYADLLVAETKEFRHGQNEIWKGLRRLSQEKGQPLVITATQADAKSYEANRLKMINFSEDKRKYAHVTALWGLNQDSKDREKKLGILRINEIVIREGAFSNSNEVTVLQNLRRGRPFLGSYW